MQTALHTGRRCCNLPVLPESEAHLLIPVREVSSIGLHLLVGVHGYDHTPALSSKKSIMFLDIREDLNTGLHHGRDLLQIIDPW